MLHVNAELQCPSLSLSHVNSLDLTQLSRLVFECGLSMAGGIGLGDMPLLFSSVSVQGLIDFTAACHIIQ